MASIAGNNKGPSDSTSGSVDLPALKAARLKANDDVRWWIDAAIQAAEESSRKTKQRGKQ